MQDKTTTSRTGSPSHPSQELPYGIELRQADNHDKVERVLARAVNSQLAHAMFRAAQGEYPERRITLRKGTRIIADSSG